LCVIRRHFLWVRADNGGNVFFVKYGGPSDGSQQSGGNIFFTKYGGPSGGYQQSGGKHFFREIRWPVRRVPAVRWRNNYFARNKEALPCSRRGPSCQPLHVQYSSDGSRSLTTMTMLRREHQGGERRRGLGRGRHGAGEDAAVEARAERSTRVH
jgi:hypothetical protein